MSEVRVFKTLQGVDYIGKVVEETDTSYVLEDVFAAAVYQSDNGNISLNFGMIVHPLLGAVNSRKNNAIERITLNRVGVVFEYEPRDELRDEYTKAASGIEITKFMPGKM
jgi:hypothetical protein